MSWTIGRISAAILSVMAVILLGATFTQMAEAGWQAANATSQQRSTVLMLLTGAFLCAFPPLKVGFGLILTHLTPTEEDTSKQ